MVQNTDENDKSTVWKKLAIERCADCFQQKGATIEIGENVTINSSFLSNLVGLYSRTIIVTRTHGAEIKIGDHVGISGATIYARKNICIGDNTLIGGNAKIIDNDFHPIEVDTEINSCAMKTAETVI